MQIASEEGYNSTTINLFSLTITKAMPMQKNSLKSYLVEYILQVENNTVIHLLGGYET